MPTVNQLTAAQASFDYANTGFSWANVASSIAKGAAEGVTVGIATAAIASGAAAAIDVLASGGTVIAATTAAYAAGSGIVVGAAAGTGIGAEAGVFGAAVGACIGAIIGMGLQDHPNLPWASWSTSATVQGWLNSTAVPDGTVDASTVGWQQRIDADGNDIDKSEWIVPSTIVTALMTPTAFAALSSWTLGGHFGDNDPAQANGTSPLFFNYAFDFYQNSGNPLRQALRALFQLHPEFFPWGVGQFDASGNQVGNTIQVPHEIEVLASLFGAIVYSYEQSSGGADDGRPDLGFKWQATDIGVDLAFQRCYEPPWFLWDDNMQTPTDGGNGSGPGVQWWFTGNDQSDMNNGDHRNAALRAMAEDVLWASKNPHAGILAATGSLVSTVIGRTVGAHINPSLIVNVSAAFARGALLGATNLTTWQKIKAWFEHAVYWIEAKVAHRGPLAVHGYVGASLALSDGNFVETDDPPSYSQNKDHTVQMWMVDPIRSTFAFDYAGLHADEDDISDALDDPSSNPPLAHILDGLSSGGLATDPDARLPILALRLTQMKRAAEALVGRALAGDIKARAEIVARVKTEDVGGIMLRDLLELAKVEPIQVKALNRPIHYNRAAYPLA